MLQVVKEQLNDYGNFINDISDMVRERMGEEYSVRIFKVLKNNSVELDSLVLLKEGKNYSPNIYLLPYYEAYVKGTDIKELAERICEIYHNSATPLVDDKFSYTFEEIKSHIVYRLVSYEKNKKLLENIPHIKYLDLAITFHCLVHDDVDGIGTIRITNEHVALWKVSLKELQKQAVSNTQKMFPPSLRSMDDVIKSMLYEDVIEEMDEDISEEMLQQLFADGLMPRAQKMYILSNQKGINGATCLLYDNVLCEFAKEIQSDLYILPSSIHEVILVPYNNKMTKDGLTEMVKDVNRTQVACDEVLSDKVYYYSRENNSITM